MISAASIAVFSLVLLVAGKKQKSTYRRKERLDRIAEEGYEFAADILYPIQNKSDKRFRSGYDELRNGVY